jgi:hypothetical protein
VYGVWYQVLGVDAAEGSTAGSTAGIDVTLARIEWQRPPGGHETAVRSTGESQGAWRRGPGAG